MAKILLVEDDNNLREIYEARLQAEGYDIVAAQDGEAALVVAKQEQPDLIISDVMMPRISGFEMLDILRNTQGMRDVKVIMLTALGQAEDKTRADKLGADRYLVKSQVTLEDIVRAASDLLGGGGDTAATAPAPVPEIPETADPALVAPVAVAPAPVAAPVAAAPASVPIAPAVPVVPTPVAPAPEPVAASAGPAVTPVVQPAPFAPSTPADPVIAPASVTPAPEPAVMPTPAAFAPEPTPITEPTPVEAPQPPEPIFAPAPAEEAPAVPEMPTLPEPVAAPAADPVVAPTPNPEPAPVETPAPADPANPSDQMMADAVKDLLGNTSTEPAPAEETPAAPDLTLPALDTIAAPAPDAQPVADAAPAPAADQNTSDPDTTTRKKIIQPLTTGNEPTAPDLNELLAKEGITDFDKDEQQAAPPAFAQNAPLPEQGHPTAQPHPPGHVISPNPAQPTDSQGQPVDPNSISL